MAQEGGPMSPEDGAGEPPAGLDGVLERIAYVCASESSRLGRTQGADRGTFCGGTNPATDAALHGDQAQLCQGHKICPFTST